MNRGRETNGGVFESRGKLYMRVTVAPQTRPAVQLPNITDRKKAKARAQEVNALAQMLRESNKTEYMKTLLEQGATLPDERMGELRAMIESLASGLRRPKAKVLPHVTTFADVRRKWTSGELSRDYPHAVAAKRTSADDAGRAENWIETVVGPKLIAMVTLEDYEEVMRRARGAGIADATAWQIAQTMRRTLDLAVYPLKLIASNPIPKAAMPKIRTAKLGRWLYPSEDAQLLACHEVELGRRLLFGFLTRLGWRKSEAIGGHLDTRTKARRIPPLTWSAIDLSRGVVNLDKNKTDDPRIVVLGGDVVRALKAWRAIYPGGEPAGDAAVFVERVALKEGGELSRTVNRDRLAEELRDDLAVAKVARVDELRKETDTHDALDVHDLRASFVTVALANDKSERWICDRTGHKSHSMIERYRRQARTFAELHVGDWTPLDEAIPELQDIATVQAVIEAFAVLSAPDKRQQNGSSEIQEVAAMRTSPMILRGDRRGSNPRQLEPQGESASVTSREIAESSTNSNVDATDGNRSQPLLPLAATSSIPIVTAEDALAIALERASAAGRWEVVATLAEELRARRLAVANVPTLDEARARKR